MSGLVGYIGHREAKTVILDALGRLEYRGYDSAGLSIISGKSLEVFRTLGRPAALTEKLVSKKLKGKIGIGHTRWASHGKPSIKNAHPHSAGNFAVVHNGIIANANSLKQELIKGGVKFRSETDTEVIPHLINKNWRGTSLVDTVIASLNELRGGYTCCVISSYEPDLLVAVRKGNPLVIGLGEGETIVASDVTAIAPYTNRLVFLRDGEIAVLTHEGVQFLDFNGEEIEPEQQKSNWNVVRSEKRGYRHYLLKEIVESPRAVRATLEQYFRKSGEENLSPTDISFPKIGKPSRVIFCGSGSSYYSAIMGKSLCETIAGISTSDVVASEFRYGQGVVEKNALYVVISQSGESRDTLESARFAIEQGAKVMSITSNPSSSLARLAHYPIVTQAGPEVSVVSSKTFSATAGALAILSFYLGRNNGNLKVEEQQGLLNEILSIPNKMELTITHESMLRRLAERFAQYRSFFIVGRGVMYPVAQYSALLMKEIVNIHAESVLAGEIKHGAISLFDKGTPVLFFANQKFLKEQLVNDMNELEARGVEVIVTGYESGLDIASKSNNFISVPETDDRLSPILAIAPAQLFIYYLGLYNRKDVDRPRNVAKSVTV